MHTVIKKNGKQVQAWCLGDNSPMEQNLLAAGRIRKTTEGYELFSQEARDGIGQKALTGDYFKVDSAGYPYPNDRSFFLANHRYLSNDTYEQLPKPLQAWFSTDPDCEEVRFLEAHKGLKRSPDTPDRYFEAPLWGSVLSADADAVLLFYSIDRNEAGTITDASFNFVAKSEFEQSYRLL